MKGKFPEKSKLPSNIPRGPKKKYEKTNEWIDWPDFLGYERKKAPRKGTRVWDMLYGNKED